jgi:hypothetical protein
MICGLRAVKVFSLFQGDDRNAFLQGIKKALLFKEGLFLKDQS